MSISPTKKAGEKVARPYQLQILEHAINHNSIIYLPTGSGKTYIAIMLIRHFSKELHKPLDEGGKRCVFLCNTVELARQNALEIANVTNFKVGLFIGDMNVDNWPQEKWESEIFSNQVFVGTSQVFVDMVSHQYLSINNLSCVVMDECHHATKSHPMHRFLSLFSYAPNQSDLPRVVGLTGVLLKSTKKGDILKPLEDLEAVFRGKIITVRNLNEFHNVLLYSTKPNEIMLKYADQSMVFDIELQIKAIVDKCCAQLEHWDMGEKQKMSKGLQALREPNKLKQVKSLLADFVYQMDDMGIYAASIAIMAAIVQLEVNKRNAETMIFRTMYRYTLTKCELIRHLLVKKLKSFIDDEDDEDDMDEADVIQNFCKPKLRTLLSYLVSEFSTKKGDEISALVFVQRRYTAKCLYFVIKNFCAAHPLLKHIIPEFMVGRTSGMIYTIDTILDSKWNRHAIQRFRSKECNLIVCSSVLEEGIDVQACNYVISFDSIKTFSSYVQMKGRARSQDSTYAILCERLKQNEVAQQIQQYQKTDAILKNYLITRTIDREIPSESLTAEQFKELVTPFKTRTGAILQAEATLMLLHRYCQKLPQDSFTNSQALWSIVLNEESPAKCVVSLQLPLQSTIKEVILSDVMKTVKTAKLSAAFKACVKLYQNGEIDDNLLPVTRQKIIESCTETYFAKWKNEANDNAREAGSTKNIRDYKKIFPEELTGSLPVPGEIAYAYCISIKPEFRLDEDNSNIINLLNSNSNYAIVLRKKLPALAPMPLFMTQGPLKAKISNEPFEFIINDNNELAQLKKFNKMIFSDIRKYWKRFLALDNRNGPNAFLIAPVQHNCAIDWELVRQFPKLTKMRATTAQERLKKVHNPEDYLGKVVSTWYSADENIRYVVTKIRHDLTPLSPFPSNSFKNYAEYVENKYRERVVNTNQFMIEVQAFTSRSNFFINSSGKNTESKRMKRDSKILVIPEMCHNFRYPGDLWLKALFLPCILHRLHYLLNAEKLRVDINRYLGIPMDGSYKPACIEIDYSLRRVGTESKEPKSMLPPLETTRRDDKINSCYNLVDVEQGNWKAYLEPIDVYRNINTVYPIEVDYYYQFVNNLLEDMENLKLDEAPEVSMRNLEAHKPKIRQHYIDELTKRIADVSFDPARRIKILDEHVGSAPLKTAEQFEFLAAITTGKTNDYFDMERFEVLGDSFLKFSSSLLLMHRHQSWNEGYLTAIKSRLVSNRNLLYCMRAKFNGTFICSSVFEPTSEWLPPCSSVPSNILEAIEHKGLSPNCLYEVNLSEEEINTGKCNQNTLQNLCDNTQLSETSIECLYEFIYKQAVPDKVIADSLEALLGVCVKNYGPEKSFEMLDYFGIFYDADKTLLRKLLQINLGNPLLKANVKQSVIDGYLLNYEMLEHNLKYKFKDRAYLLQALTHPSYPTNRVTGCYQQLEFLGDAILDFLMSCYIFERCKHMNPGEITDLRSSLVNNVTLACVCVRNRFHQYILYESPTLSESIRKFVEFQNTQDHRVTEQVKILLEETVVDPESFNMAQNIDVPKTLGDVLEALIGAVFLDSGNDLRCTWNVISELMDIELTEFIAEVPLDPVRQLYEYKGAKPEFQKECAEYDVVMMKCQFYCRDLVKTVIGCGCNKEMAKKAAAKMALQILHSN
ncbi:endoribonuclease Dicer [Episyrphus balteatus]|uniref:endoribonuclease Dicer n=1 Tax=Episyrphus balteatus TaxID=286459 RepID=UPI002486622D|nr:endoribonuclease Dicer [Episyrphus balteatus]